MLTDTPWATLPPGDDPTDAYQIHVAAYWRHVARRITRPALIVITVAIATSLLVGCDASPGVVTGRHVSPLGGTTHYFVTVKHEKSGKKLDEDVPSSVFASCTKGDRWPDCGK